METMKDQILTRIEGLGPGAVFTAKDFLDIASRGMVDVTLSKLLADGSIRRIRRGLYDSPKSNPTLGGALSPDIDRAAQALARRRRWKIVPDGTWAANLLGLSTQVPAKIIYLSDGPNTLVPIGRRTICFKHARPQTFSGVDGKSALVVQALRYLGKKGVAESTILRLRELLPVNEQKQLVKATRFGIDWIYQTARTIAKESK